jgi:hypothetical protein
MGLETFTFISSFNTANPVGATDPKSAGDNHIRGMKAAILATFAAITGAVTASHTELNNLTGVTGKTGTGNLVLSASPTLTGTVTAGTVNASSLGTSPLNASNLSSGTVPDARFPATLPAASGVNLTALNASNIASGSLADARLSSNVPLKNAANTFTDFQTLSGSKYLIFDNSGVYGYIGAGSPLGGTAGNLGMRAEVALQFFTGGGNPALTISSSGNYDFKAGTVTTTGGSASEVGFKGIPVVDKRGSSWTLTAADNGKHIIFNSGATLTVPAGLPIGFACTTQQCQSSGTMTVAQSSTTIYWSGTDFTSGNRTISRAGVASIVSYDTDVFLISGTDIS